MKKLIFFLLITINCLSQTGTIQGNVYNRIEKTKERYVGIKLISQKKNKIIFLNDVRTDSLGNFKIEKVKTGIYSLIISYPLEYDDTLENIEVAKNTITYVNVIVPPICIYENEFVSKDILKKNCPICKKSDNVVNVSYTIYLGSGYRIDKKKIKEDPFLEYEEFDNKENVYKISKQYIPYCHSKYYCKKDKVKF
jgi:transposase-like protein